MELEATPRQSIERAAAAPVERQKAARLAGCRVGDLVTLDDDRPSAASAHEVGESPAVLARPARLNWQLCDGISVWSREIETLLRAVRPTEWFGSKITGVDLASDFVWIDDAPLRVEIETLRGLGLLNRLLVVDTDDGLLRAVDVIRVGLSAIEV
jgi:hypothetical protein